MFNDPHVKEELDFILLNLFNHVPAGVREYGDFAGESYEEFWWRETVDHDGYLMVWYDGDNKFNTFHTYRYPPDIYS